MNHNCSITCAKEITIGGNCNLANNIVIVDHDHNIGDTGVVAGLNSKLIYIGNNVWIGANVTILKGVIIGDDAIVAAGAVVRQDIPNCEIWGGVPARKICKLGERYVN
ncbi:acyltransferase [Agathobacter rectalis]|nr:acyltransferase [Agathobacter rectalis]